MWKKVIGWLRKYISDNGFEGASVEKHSVEEDAAEVAPAAEFVTNEIVPTQVDSSKYRIVKNTYGDGRIGYYVQYHCIVWTYLSLAPYATKEEATKFIQKMIDIKTKNKVVKSEVVS